MGKIRVCIIGAGNISNTRHIPAILQNNDMQITGIVSDEKKKIKRTIKNHRCLENCHTLTIEHTDDIEKQLHNCEWFKNNVDAVVIGTPPRQHYPMAKACLILGKHVLVEKPMMMNCQECEETLSLAQNNHLVFYVMHSFQFSKGISELYKRYSNGELGKLKSILEIQLTNRDRRLPLWYNDLPLGLYYDEAAHFFYSARRFGGKLKVLNAHAVFNSEKDNTPVKKTATMDFLFFITIPPENSLICYYNTMRYPKKWYIVLSKENKKRLGFLLTNK